MINVSSTHFEKRRDEIDILFDRSEALIALSANAISKVEEASRNVKEKKRLLRKAIKK